MENQTSGQEPELQTQDNQTQNQDSKSDQIDQAGYQQVSRYLAACGDCC